MCAAIISGSLREKQLLIEPTEGRAELMASRTAAPPAGHTRFCIAVSEGPTFWGPLLVVPNPTPACPSAHTDSSLGVDVQPSDRQRVQTSSHCQDVVSPQRVAPPAEGLQSHSQQDIESGNKNRRKEEEERGRRRRKEEKGRGGERRRKRRKEEEEDKGKGKGRQKWR